MKTSERGGLLLTDEDDSVIIRCRKVECPLMEYALQYEKFQEQMGRPRTDTGMKTKRTLNPNDAHELRDSVEMKCTHKRRE